MTIDTRGSRAKTFFSKNYLVLAFVSFHLLFAIFLGRLFALAPDEGGYLYTFNNLYGGKDPNPQFNSGWITAPKPFLWIAYLPAKILNLAGVPDYLSIRILSIAIATISLILLRNLQRKTYGDSHRFEWVLVAFFFIPSIFLWTSVGLREVFILLEMSLAFSGLRYLLKENLWRGLIYLVLGSYALLSTKNYIWICFVLSALVISAIMALQKVQKRKILSLIAGTVLIPCIFFASTTSVYALQFLVASVFHANLSETGARSGDSIVQVAIARGPNGTNATLPSGGQGNSSNSSSGQESPNNVHQTLITFHGDSTLILFHFYLQDHPKAFFSRVMRALGVSEEIQRIWESKLRSGLVKKSVKATPDTSSLNGYILKPGKLSHPLSVVLSSGLFLFGPIPLVNHGGLALNIVSFESPLWWLLYGFVLYRLVRYRKSGYILDPVFQLAGIYFASLVAISALVEVNLGTSFRHRSILLVPLIVMYIRAKREPSQVVA